MYKLPVFIRIVKFILLSLLWNFQKWKKGDIISQTELTSWRIRKHKKKKEK